MQSNLITNILLVMILVLLSINSTKGLTTSSLHQVSTNSQIKIMPSNRDLKVIQQTLDQMKEQGWEFICADQMVLYFKK